jgi:hypothetical protein
VTAEQLQFFHADFLTVLRRHRYMTLAGWLVVIVGLAAVPLSWRFGSPHGLIDTLLAVCTILAGLLVVQQAVTALTTYVHTPFPKGEDEEPAVAEIRALMKEVDEAGSWEAILAIGRLEDIAERYQLNQS